MQPFPLYYNFELEVCSAGYRCISNMKFCQSENESSLDFSHPCLKSDSNI